MKIIIEGDSCPPSAHWHYNGAPWEMHASRGLICPVRFSYHDPASGVLESVVAVVQPPLAPGTFVEVPFLHTSPAFT